MKFIVQVGASPGRMAESIRWAAIKVIRERGVRDDDPRWMEEFRKEFDRLEAIVNRYAVDVDARTGVADVGLEIDDEDGSAAVLPSSRPWMDELEAAARECSSEW